jgi:hypothetical protein
MQPLMAGVMYTLKADSHIACRTHAVPLPCHAAKGLECVFPIWFTQCGRVWFTLAMPRPCHALTVPFFSRPWHSTVVKRRPVGYLPAFGFFRLPHGVPWRLLSEAYQSSSQWSIHTTVKSGSSTLQKGRSVNCWTSSSDISGYHADFHEGHGTVGAGQGRGMTRGTAWARHAMCESALNAHPYIWVGQNFPFWPWRVTCNGTGILYSW